ncbi:Gfo/Idh/MocA family oxidoreductase [Rhizobium sp. SIMBA_035]
MNSPISNASFEAAARPATVGFVGVGWIGRQRMEAMIATGAVEAAFIVEPSEEMAKAAMVAAPGAELVGRLDDLLGQDVDGIVIATPSAQHAEQSIRSLEAGHAVFCQKPLGRSLKEVNAVLAAARTADRLLSVDLSYRHTHAMEQIKGLLQSGELGEVRAVDLTFHNAYGPDKKWFYKRSESGGGCVIDLGVHMIDLALWSLDFPEIVAASSSLMFGGRPVSIIAEEVEDYALATLQLASGTVVRLACSWGLNAGCDCVIDASFYGSKGGAAIRNLNGSFYDFYADHLVGTQRRRLVDPPDDWGGRAAIDWARRLAAGARFDKAAEHLAEVSRAMDMIYQSGSISDT